VRRVVRRETGVSVKPDQIVTALRKMLNETAASMLEDIEVSLPQPATRQKKGGAHVTWKKVFEAGLVPPGTVLFVDYQDHHYEATVQEDGTILFEGKAYRTPSGAGEAVTSKYGVSGPNGWTFWQFKDASGTAQPLRCR